MVGASWKELTKAIKAHCIECFGGVQSEVKHCTGRDCNLYPFRLGVKQRGRKGHPDSLQKAREALRDTG